MSSTRFKVYKWKSTRLLGTIPPSMGNLWFLVSLDLSKNYNYFSGSISQEMSYLRRIKEINLNFNDLRGGLPRCQKSKTLPIKIDLQPMVEHRRITHPDTLEATDGFDESNLLGNGSFGSVYKGVLSDGTVVAIKVFKLQQERALKSFHVEKYGLGGSVSRSFDVYSYGIMLMETFTGKKPTDEMFAGHMTLKCWVKESLPSTVIQVIDRNLLRQESENSLADVDCVSSILILAVDCAADSPEQRIDMKDVLATLKKIKGDWIRAKVNNIASGGTAIVMVTTPVRVTKGLKCERDAAT
ncbi:hypothetical protein RJ640_023967 [Escallonia rubra]|uniref:Protein kinase domain-containing protein n=1 Tax=Escallonia rubra TaxID=112253 RepID=A0AA88RD58_9ASTE|nr:hypothetical protein RJ640_023967 [Escallonia rubra]